MIFTWFKIFNTDEFDALGLVSRTYTYVLGDLGQKDILVTKGVTHGITYEGVFLSVLMTDLNPYVLDGFAVYKDADKNVYLGIEVPDEN